ncbi:hypothetical protein [Jiulongibacter sp. NS-SX5]|uniref:hypothetical protein n=1 Tax=Jiulongibacter sp. NS-SX5 TaxID=3463854 RepID=UPI00405A070D
MKPINSNRGFQPLINIFSHAPAPEEKIFFLLRFGILGCFVGHGMWGLITKEGWLPFFEVFFINPSTAYMIMPAIGLLDVLTGFLCFYRPNRALLIWAAFWTTFTALLRPSANMGMSEFFERAGNYGVPFAFLFLYGFPKNNLQLRVLLNPLPAFSESQIKGLEFILRLFLFWLLAGHGSLALFKLSLLLQSHLNYLGLSISSTSLQLIGLSEIILAVIVFLLPRSPKLISFVLAWKLAWELVFPFAGKAIDILETIERMGDYIIPATLLIIYKAWPKQEFRIFP